VANYPFDLSRERGENIYSRSPDDATFRYLAQSYSLWHANMANISRPKCDLDGSNDNFAKKGGITNGARWYSVEGGMQDFNYLASNCFEITLELSCQKFPAAELLAQYWQDNQKALYHFMWQVHMGVKGVIQDAETGQLISNAVIWATNMSDSKNPDLIRHPVTSASTGDYWRLLMPGVYNVTVQAKGYFPVSKLVTVMESKGQEFPVSQRVDFDLKPVAPRENGELDLQTGQQVDDNQVVEAAVPA